MAANPSVCAVCLTRDRPEMLKRAVSSFYSQTYAEKILFVLDTSGSTETIGELRNRANSQAVGSTEDNPDGAVVFHNPDIIIHWDDDDWSHPNRIAEQVAMLQASGADAVGYNEMLFWRAIQVQGGGPVLDAMRTTAQRVVDRIVEPEAWLYRNRDPRYAVGTSLCYWRETWESNPFPALPRKRGGMGEDHAWIQGMAVFSGSSLLRRHPRMIASIHGGNSMPYDDLDRKDVTEWTRVPEWDDHCRKVMVL
jgi:glycosyltransferase involved in cell wall biosynthesis